MKTQAFLKLIIMLILAVLFIHIAAIFTGLYQGKVWIDIPQHIISGIMLGLIWLMFIKDAIRNKMLVAVSIISFAVLGSFLWEIFEFVLLQLSPSLEETVKFYSRTLGDALSDMFYGFLGGVLVAMITLFKKNKGELRS